MAAQRRADRETRRTLRVHANLVVPAARVELEVEHPQDPVPLARLDQARRQRGQKRAVRRGGRAGAVDAVAGRACAGGRCRRDGRERGHGELRSRVGRDRNADAATRWPAASIRSSRRRRRQRAARGPRPSERPCVGDLSSAARRRRRGNAVAIRIARDLAMRAPPQKMTG